MDETQGRYSPIYLVVMGVSGCGKSTVSALLARRLGCEFIDGDDLHPAANVAKMHAGTPLDDRDRQPWLEKIAAVFGAWRLAGKSGVIACSALRHDYRDIIRANKNDVTFVYLHGDAALLSQRLAGRQGHFMPPQLLASQLSTLEEPTASERAVTVDAALRPDEQIERIVHALGVTAGKQPLF